MTKNIQDVAQLDKEAIRESIKHLTGRKLKDGEIEEIVEQVLEAIEFFN